MCMPMPMCGAAPTKVRIFNGIRRTQNGFIWFMSISCPAMSTAIDSIIMHEYANAWFVTLHMRIYLRCAEQTQSVRMLWQYACARDCVSWLCWPAGAQASRPSPVLLLMLLMMMMMRCYPRRIPMHTRTSAMRSALAIFNDISVLFWWQCTHNFPPRPTALASPATCSCNIT